MESSRGLGNFVNLDDAVNDIAKLIQNYNALLLQNSYNLKKANDLEKQLERSKEQEEDAQKSNDLVKSVGAMSGTGERCPKEYTSIQQLYDMIERLQSMLSKRCDLEDENKMLQASLNKKEEISAQQKTEYESHLKEAQMRLEDTEKEHAKEMSTLQNKAETQRNKEVHLLDKTLQDKAMEVKQLQKQLADAERDRHTEIVKLRLEYDAKLMKLQKENQVRAQMQQHSMSSGANSALLRQKMLNAKAASTQEVNILKRTIADLHRELRAAQHHDKGNFDKKRRY